MLKALRRGTEVRRKEIKDQEGRRGLSGPWQNKDTVRVFRALRCVVRMYCWKHDLKYANWFSFVALPVVSTNERYFPTESLFTVTSECVIAGVPVWITWLWDCVCCQRHPSLAVFQFLLVYLVLVRLMHPSGWDSSIALLETWFIRPVSVSLWPLRWQSIFSYFREAEEE